MVLFCISDHYLLAQLHTLASCQPDWTWLTNFQPALVLPPQEVQETNVQEYFDTMEDADSDDSTSGSSSSSDDDL